MKLLRDGQAQADMFQITETKNQLIITHYKNTIKYNYSKTHVFLPPNVSLQRVDRFEDRLRVWSCPDRF